MFPVLGVVAGILAGLLGIGGGLVLVAALGVLYWRRARFRPTRDAHADADP